LARPPAFFPLLRFGRTETAIRFFPLLNRYLHVFSGRTPQFFFHFTFFLASVFSLFFPVPPFLPTRGDCFFFFAGLRPTRNLLLSFSYRIRKKFLLPFSPFLSFARPLPNYPFPAFLRTPPYFTVLSLPRVVPLQWSRPFPSLIPSLSEDALSFIPKHFCGAGPPGRWCFFFLRFPEPLRLPPPPMRWRVFCVRFDPPKHPVNDPRSLHPFPADEQPSRANSLDRPAERCLVTLFFSLYIPRKCNPSL